MAFDLLNFFIEHTQYEVVVEPVVLNNRQCECVMCFAKGQAFSRFNGRRFHVSRDFRFSRLFAGVGPDTLFDSRLYTSQDVASDHIAAAICEAFDTLDKNRNLASFTDTLTNSYAKPLRKKPVMAKKRKLGTAVGLQMAVKRRWLADLIRQEAPAFPARYAEIRYDSQRSMLDDDPVDRTGDDGGGPSFLAGPEPD